MALRKTQNIKGHDCEYWRIAQLDINVDRADATISLQLYKDKAERDANVKSVMHTHKQNLGEELLGTDYTGSSDKVKNISIKEAYKALKRLATTEDAKTEGKNESLAFFADAVDV